MVGKGLLQQIRGRVDQGQLQSMAGAGSNWLVEPITISLKEWFT